MTRTTSLPWTLLVALCLAGCRATATPPALSAMPTSTTRPPAPTSTTEATVPAPPTATPFATLMPLAPISADDRSIGPADAAVTILVYSDFQCPYCAQLAFVLTALRQSHPADVRIIFRHFPIISLHDKASLAGRAADAAGEQGRFWEMHDLIFAGQAEWAVLPVDKAEAWFLRAAGDLGLNPAQFRRDVQDTAAAERMQQAYLTGLASGIPGTPFVFFNGDLLQIDPSQQNLEAMTRLTLLNLANAGATLPPPADSTQALKAILRFNLGTLEVVLFPASAPQAVGSFVDLARRGWYDGSPVSRVLPGRIVELGDPTGTGYGDAGYRFAEEIDASLEFDRPGVVALSSSGPNTNGSLFFITLDAVPELTGGRTIFGQVVGGLDVLQGLPARDPLPDLLEPSPAILEHVDIVAP